jgi:hypothetical protein
MLMGCGGADDGYASVYPDLQVSDGRLAIRWFDVRDGDEEIYLAITDPMRLDVESRAMRVTHTAGHSIGAYLAWSGERLGLAWCDDTSDRYEIFLAAFDADGKMRSPPSVLSDGSPHHWVPAILAWREGFAVAWTSGKRPRGHAPTASAVTIELIERLPGS